MEHLDFGGKKYIKVSSAARETGYTSDYIGQLCRGGKIDAKLVGRTWYVAHEQIRSHRHTRGRSSREKVHQNVKDQIAQTAETVVPIRLGNALQTHRKGLLDTQVLYHHDDTELIPTVTRSEKITVLSRDKEEVVHMNATERHVDITSDSRVQDTKVDFTPASHKDVQWNGTIVVEPLEQGSEETSQEKDFSSDERHIRMKVENERNIKPNLVISGSTADPIEAKQRFIERMNLAHELNENSRENTQKHTSLAPHKTLPTTHVKIQNERRSYGSGHFVHALATFLLGISTTLALLFVLTTTFLHSEAEYRAPHGGSRTPVFLSTFGFSSLDTARKALTEQLSKDRLAAGAHILHSIGF